MVGNQVEVKMFTAVGWTLIETKGDDTPVVKSPTGEKLTIVKRYEFDHARMSMSVIVKDESGDCHSFSKGSYERIHHLCQVGDASTMPPDYLSVAKNHAMNGCYVLGVAYRSLGKLTEEQIKSMTRDASEEGLRCLGLILFRNELKEDSREAVTLLKNGSVRPAMITGDNAQCGNYIAKSSAMISEDAKVVLAELNKKTHEIEWREMGVDDATVLTTEQIKAEVAKIEARTGGGYQQGQEVIVMNPDEKHDERDLELAIATGKAWEKLCEDGDMEPLLLHTRIFARTSPENKVEVIQAHIAKGLIVGMCGDGGNDCGALRAAHAGVALSEAEASVVSPFTAKTKSAMSVVDLHREGRASLANSFASYKFLITCERCIPL